MKKISIILLTLCFSLLFCGAAFATVINEAEPNDTRDQAQVIERNTQTAQEFLNGNSTNQKAVVGAVYDSSDVDWYKVYLPADNQTVLSINSTALSDIGHFVIYDASENPIADVLHHKDPAILGATPNYVSIPAAGDYYIRVSSIVGGEYRFTIGGPNYGSNHYVHNATSACTLTTTIRSVQATYDLRNVAAIPDRAVVYYVSINGTKTNYCTNEARSIKLQTDSSWITTARYSWIANIPLTSNKILKNNWVFKLDGTVTNSSKPYSLIPSIYFSYVYPILPQ